MRLMNSSTRNQNIVRIYREPVGEEALKETLQQVG